MLSKHDAFVLRNILEFLSCWSSQSEVFSMLYTYKRCSQKCEMCILRFHLVEQESCTYTIAVHSLHE